MKEEAKKGGYRLWGDKWEELEKKFMNVPLGLNTEQPHISIKMPIFAISGTHDDWASKNQIGPLDYFHEQRFINYVGKVLSEDELNIIPLRFTKGSTRVNLFPI